MYQHRGRNTRQRDAENSAAFQQLFGSFADGVQRRFGASVVGDGGANLNAAQLLAAGRQYVNEAPGILEQRSQNSDDESDEDSVFPAHRGSSRGAPAGVRERRVTTLTNESPHAQDVTAQAYAILQLQRNSTGNKKTSVEKKINPVFEYWKGFCTAASITTAEGQKEHLRFLDSNKEHDMVKIRSFVKYMDSMDPLLTLGQFENGMLFIQHHLNKELAANDKPKIIGAVKGDPVVKEIYTRRKKSKAVQCLENGEDFQSKIANKLAEQGFHPTTLALQSLHPISLMNTVASLLHTHQTGQRGEDLRSFSLAMGFTRQSEYVGPGDGTELNFAVTKLGKTNKVGKNTYSAFAPHNPSLIVIRTAVKPTTNPVTISTMTLWFSHR
jgi:hypothetical protein